MQHHSCDQQATRGGSDYFGSYERGGRQRPHVGRWYLAAPSLLFQPLDRIQRLGIKPVPPQRLPSPLSISRLSTSTGKIVYTTLREQVRCEREIKCRKFIAVAISVSDQLSALFFLYEVFGRRIYSPALFEGLKTYSSRAVTTLCGLLTLPSPAKLL